MARPDLQGCEQVKGGENAASERNRTGRGLGTEDSENAAKTDEHWDWRGLNLACKLSLKMTLENLPGTDLERFEVEMSGWNENDPSIKRGENLTSTTGEPKMEILYSGAPAGVCPGARLQARVGGDRARSRLRREALTSGLQPSLSSIACADFTRKGWRARSDGSFPWSRSWLDEECRGPSGYAGTT